MIDGIAIKIIASPSPWQDLAMKDVIYQPQSSLMNPAAAKTNVAALKRIIETSKARLRPNLQRLLPMYGAINMSEI